MAIQIEKPEIKHKYISLFDTEAEFNAAYPNFEEVNWSDVAYPQERPDNYRVSRRLSNMYHKNTPPDYKFDDINDFVVEGDVTYYADGAYIGTFNEDDYTNGNIRKTFFLEIVWGYSGWEWHDYERVIGTDPETEEPITETLTGGNLYKIKNIQTVPHIIDGHRLQHINDFLFSQYNVTKIEGFNTSNLVAANRAFKRGTNDDTNYPKRHLNQAVECHFVDGYNIDGTFAHHPIGYADPVTGESLLENLVEADGLFYNNRIYMYEGDSTNTIPFVIPNITSIDKLYAYGFYTEGLKFKFDKLEKLTNAFMGACFYDSVLNLNEIFVGETLKKITDFNHMLYLASLVGYSEDSDHTMHVSLDLTDSTVDSDTVIDLSSFIEFAGTEEQGLSYSPVANSVIDVNLNFNNKVNLDSAFRYLIGNKPRNWKMGDDQRTFHLTGSFAKMALNFNNKENYIDTIKYGLANNTFIEAIPVTQVPNNDCDDSYIYQGCIFNAPISYNFLNGSIASPRVQGYGQFNDCTINDSYTFSNIQGLDRVEICGIKFGDNVPAANRIFPYTVQNQSDTTYRYFDITNSKFIGTLPTQNIYIDSEKLRNSEDRYGIGTGNINPFARCSELTDLSNIHLYFSEINPDSNIQYSFDFSGCTNLIKTPYIHFNYLKTGFTYFGINCRNLHNLTTVNFENLTFNGIHDAINSNVNFKDCEDLVYLKIGTADAIHKCYMSLDVRGCFSLDTDTLGQTIHSMDRGEIKIMKSIWSNLNEGDLDTGLYVQYCRTNNIGVNVIEDSSYVPGS